MPDQTRTCKMSFKNAEELEVAYQDCRQKGGLEKEFRGLMVTSDKEVFRGEVKIPDGWKYLLVFNSAPWTEESQLNQSPKPIETEFLDISYYEAVAWLAERPPSSAVNSIDMLNKALGLINRQQSAQETPSTDIANA